MGRRKGSGNKVKKRKKVLVKLIQREHAGKVTEPWRIMEEIRREFHGNLSDVKIGMAWRAGWRADTDGHLRCGQCRKRGDLDRELDGFDFVVLLNQEAWPALNEKQKRALVDHELCHAQVTCDADGQPKKDDRDRLVCRTKKHDVEEFRCIVERHGMWTQDLEAIVKAAIADNQRPLLAASESANESTAGESSGPCPRGGDHEPDADGDCSKCKEPGVGGAKSAATSTTSTTGPESWRSIRIDSLGDLKPAEIDILAAESINTIGDWVDWPRTHQGIEYTQIKNHAGRLTEARYERVADAINQAVADATQAAEDAAASAQADDVEITESVVVEGQDEEVIDDDSDETLDI